MIERPKGIIAIAILGALITILASGFHFLAPFLQFPLWGRVFVMVSIISLLSIIYALVSLLLLYKMRKTGYWMFMLGGVWQILLMITLLIFMRFSIYSVLNIIQFLPSYITPLSLNIELLLLLKSVYTSLPMNNILVDLVVIISFSLALYYVYSKRKLFK